MHGDGTSDATDQNAVASAGKKLRRKITKVLAAEAVPDIGLQDVMANKGQGYRLADHITVAGSCQANNDAANAQDDPVHDPVNEQDDPAMRRAWAMIELKRDRQLRRSDIVTKFGVSDSTAKRDFQSLTKAGKAEFVGPKKTGHYRFKSTGN